MTSWVESWYNGWYVCARELQNFDGKHEGIKLVRMFFSMKSFHSCLCFSVVKHLVIDVLC